MLVGKQPGRAGVRRRVLDPGRAQHVVDRDQDAAELGDGEEDLDKLDRVAGKDRRPLPLGEAGRGEADGDPVAALVELAVGDPALAEDQRDPLGAPLERGPLRIRSATE